MLSRRAALGAGAALLAGWAGGFRPASAGATVEIRMISRALGAEVGFAPVGLRLAPGTRLRWVVEAGVHTTTAYHPANDRHPLRIPSEAQPWDSGYLVEPGASFEVVLAVEGVYDYFCAPHEQAGMVGRIVVGEPGGPGARPFDYFKGRAGTEAWRSVPPAARAAFPSVETILREGRIERT